MKYHLNPFTGEPNRCTATVKACPWGGEDAHYPNINEAREAYEILMRDEVLMLHMESALSYGTERDQWAKSEDEEREEKEWEAAKARRTYLSSDEVERISTDGVECPACGRQVSPLAAAIILKDGDEAACPCGVKFDLRTVKLTVGESKDTYLAFDADAVKTMTWYHSTDSDDWHTYLYSEEGFITHLGSQQAAFDRRLAEDYSTSVQKPGFWLYAVQVDETAKIDPEVAPDENEDYSLDSARHKTADVVRYVNKWEDMASISLAARSKSLTAISRRFVTAEEALASPSLYNVKLPEPDRS